MPRDFPKSRTILKAQKKSRTINPGPFSGLYGKIPDSATKAPRKFTFLARRRLDFLVILRYSNDDFILEINKLFYHYDIKISKFPPAAHQNGLF